MQLINIINFRENEKEYNYLKQNSYYFKDLNRNTKSFNNFKEEMKEKYKERPTDKLVNIVDNIDMITSVLDIFK